MAAPDPNILMNALDFFGKDDPEGVEKFKAVAFRALHEQRIDEELRQSKWENERLQKENATLSKELRDLQVSFDANVGDRERVLAFKSKRIDELNAKLKESEAINLSLLQTINGGVPGNENGSGAGSRAAMASLINSGKPLFHALETCKEHEFKRLYDDKRVQCEQLLQQIQENEALVREMRVYQGQKEVTEAQIKQLRDQIVSVATEKDDKVHFLERKLVFEHDRLRREKEADIRACQDAMEKQMRMQLDVTTQRTIEENERVQLELRYQSSQLEKMVKQMDHLMTENKQTQQEKRIFEDMNASLSKKVKFYEQLFAKMQQRDQVKSRQAERHPPQGVEPRNHRFHTPRKPPLPSIGSPHSPTAFSAFGASPPQSPRVYGRREEDDPSYSDEEHFPDGGDQLNAVSNALEVHLQRREFTKKQIDAVLRYHQNHYQHQQQQQLLPRASKTSDREKGIFMGQTPLVKKKIMLSKAAYSPSSYQRGRKMLEVPTTLDAFIRENAAISPRQRTVSAAKCTEVECGGDGAAPTPFLPTLTPANAPSQDRSDMWKAQHRPESPATARF